MALSASRLGFFLGTIFSVVCLLGSPAIAQDIPSAETYAAHPRYSTASISPDGNRLALVIPEDGGDRVVMISFSDPNDRKSYTFNRGIVTKVEWYNNEAVIIRIYGRFSTIPQTSVRSYIAKPTTNASPTFIEYIPAVLGPEGSGRSFAWSLYQVVDFFPEEEGQFLMSAYVNRQPGMQRFGSAIPNVWGNDLLRAFVNGGQARALEQGHEYTGQWLTDGHGNIVARVDVLESGRQVVFVPDGSRYREVASLDAESDNTGDILGLSLDGSAIVVRAQLRNRFGLYPVSLTDGTWGEAIFYNDDFDVGPGAFLRDERNYRVNGIIYEQNALTRYQYFDPELQSLQETLEGVFPDHSVRIVSTSEDRNKILFEISAPARPPALGLFDREMQSIETVSESYPDLIGSPFGDVSVHSYTAADGTQLYGTLTTPPGVPAEGLPLVVMEDTALAPSFDKFAHFLAARGYASFRSTLRQLRRIGDVSGMGELNDWVLSVQEDYLAGVNDLIAQGTVDPSRICILGNGDEAYTALMNTIDSDNMFKCAIATEPLTDLRRLLNWARFASEVSLISYNSPLVRNYDRYERDDLERLSPVTRAEDIEANVLLFGYERDDHAPSMAAALRRAGTPVEYVEYEGDYDEPAEARAENAILTYTTIERYLREQLAP